jgi:hypothetical protein
VIQGKNVVDAAKENGIQHLVFSGLKSAKEGIGKDGCSHFESKKAIYDYLVEQGELACGYCHDLMHVYCRGVASPSLRKNLEI